jgi:Alkylmercury lyase
MTAEVDLRVRRALHERWSVLARAPRDDEVAAAAGLGAGEVRAAYDRLAAAHAIELQADGSLWMVHPFSAVATGYAATVAGKRYDANCIWDALGVLALLGDGDADAEGQTLRVRGGALEPAEGVVHFAVPARRWYDDIGYT